MKDEEGVSPVIAVILMVAITVVLAATVFVLVNELGQDVGQTGPTLGMTTASGTSSEQWNIRVTAATQTADITEYTFVLTNATETFSSSGAGWDNPTGSSLALGDGGYHLNFTDAGDAAFLGVGDRLHVDKGGASMSGTHELEIIHRPTGSSAGSLTRNF